MSLITRFQTAFRQEDTMTPGLIQKADGTVWLVAPDGSESQITPGTGAILELLAGDGDITYSHTGPTLPNYIHGAHATLCDLSDPSNPTVISGGIYILTYTIMVESDVAFLLPITMQSSSIGASVVPDASPIAVNDCYATFTSDAILGDGDGIAVPILNPNGSDLLGTMRIQVLKIG